MNQFSSIYGQLFCCNCPAGLPDAECSGNSTLLLTYPFLGKNNYAWVAGVIGFIIFIAILTTGVICCIRRKKRMHDNEMISIIRIRRALLGPKQQDNCQHQSLINNMYEGTSCPEQGDASSETRIPMSDDDSGDNLDQLDLVEERGINIDGAMLNLRADREASSDSA